MMMFRRIFVSLFAVGIATHSLSASAETLQEALISVYNSNPALLAARAQVREIDENYIQARSEGRPSANVAGSLGVSALRSSCLLYTSPSPRDRTRSRMPSSA